jgi:putative phosphoesterase
VAGNMDSAEIKRVLPRRESFVIDGRRFGLTHGSGPSWGIADRVRNMFEDVDVIIYGHSHQPASEYIKGTLLFNPGRARKSFGILTIDDGIETEIITI